MPKTASTTSRGPSTLASWAATVIRALDAEGLDGRRLARQAGVDPASLDDPAARVPSTPVMRLFDLAVGATGNPAFGLSVARHVQPTTFYALGYAMAASRTLSESLDRLVRYRRVIGDLLTLRLEKSATTTRLIIDLVGLPRFPDAAYDAAAATTVRALRFLHGDRSLNPQAVLLQRPQPPDEAAYRRFFRAPVRFAQARTALDYPRTVLDSLRAAHNQRLAQLNDEVTLDYITRLEAQNVANRVRQALLDALPSGTPSKTAVARGLGMSPRNLQRHLARDGISFQALLLEVRLALAEGYSAAGRYSVKEMAFLLGFTNASAFSRAFKNWTGRPPSGRGAGATLRPSTRRSPAKPQSRRLR